MKILFQMLVFYFCLCGLPLRAAQNNSLQALKSASQTKFKPDSSAAVASNTVMLQMDDITHVQFVGMPASDTTSSGGAMMYSADAGLIGLFAQIMAHAAIEQGIQNSAAVKIQLQADKVLEPYLSTIATISPELLKLRCQSQCKKETISIFIDPNSPSDSAKDILISHPIFMMTQDRKSLILRNILILKSTLSQTELSKKQKTKLVLYQNVVEVVSDPIDDDSTPSNTLDDGKLVDMAGDMFTLSIDLATADLLHELTNLEDTDRTFKYKIGSSISYERGRLLKSEDKRLSIRTLRGWIESIPNMKVRKSNFSSSTANNTSSGS